MNGVGLEAIARGAGGKVQGEDRTVQLARGRIAVTEDGAEGVAALIVLEVLDAAPAGVIEEAEVDPEALLDAGDQLGMGHEIGAIAEEGIDLRIRAGELDAQGAVGLIAHVREAVLHMIAVPAGGAEEALHIPGQAAGGAHGHIAGLHEGIDDAQGPGLGQGMAGGGIPGIHDAVPLPDGGLHGGGVLIMIPIEGFRQGGKALPGIAEQGLGVHLDGVEGADVEGDEAGILPEKPLG